MDRRAWRRLVLPSKSLPIVRITYRIFQDDHPVTQCRSYSVPLSYRIHRQATSSFNRRSYYTSYNRRSTRRLRVVFPRISRIIRNQAPCLITSLYPLHVSRGSRRRRDLTLKDSSPWLTQYVQF